MQDSMRTYAVVVMKGMMKQVHVERCRASSIPSHSNARERDRGVERSRVTCSKQYRERDTGQIVNTRIDRNVVSWDVR